MTSRLIEDSFKKHPELGLTLKNETSSVYRGRGASETGTTAIIVPNTEAMQYVRTYEYCKALIKRDRFDAAKEICLSRNEFNQLPFDRLPFLALLTDPGQLVEAVKVQPKLEIVPNVKGKRVTFFYEEGHRHQRVRAGFVGSHLRTNCLCDNDVRHEHYDKAIIRAVTTPLSSQLISYYDAHIQCKALLEEFDLLSAARVNLDFGLGRDVKQEYIDFVMPIALEYREIYRRQSRFAADNFARRRGFEPVIRNGKLVTLQKVEVVANRARFSIGDVGCCDEVADVPTLNYIVPGPGDDAFIPSMH